MPRHPLFKSVLGQLRASILAERRGWSDSVLFEKIEEAAEARVSRRELLGYAAAAAAGVALTVPFPLRKAWAHPRLPDRPVTILGGGAAGLTAAYRLIRRGIPCEIYEAAPRLGGRIYTQHKFNTDGMFVERGGELIDSDHSSIIALARELGLTLEDFRPGDTGLEKETYFVEGSFRSARDLVEGFRPLAVHVLRDLAIAFPGGRAATPTYQNPYNTARFDQMTLSQYLDDKKDVASWVRELVRVCYVGEFGLEISAQSAFNLLGMVSTDTSGGVKLIGASDEALRIRGGNSSLIDRLTHAIEDLVPIHREYKLVSIKDPGTGQPLTLTFNTPAGTRDIKAPEVVCTIPFSILRDIDGVDRLALEPVKSRAIREIPYGANTKLMIGFQERYWRKSHGDKAGATGSVLTDLTSQDFWDSSRLQPGESGILTCYLGGDEGLHVRDGRLAVTLRELDRIYPGSSGYYDGRRLLEHWPSSPFAKGSYICPGPGQYTTLWGCLGQPELQGRLRFAGEHTSIDGAGYMNAGVESGERVAREIFIARGMDVGPPPQPSTSIRPRVTIEAQ